ncbi:Respiratory supercomplex factor 1, mitochondrial [Friedmanniomyces endolithicus]|uniref:Respiratory supercomplex factor 1, mitochondrial n=1 Tax=Friedmanniomyces endolithicus TaxID=329885 RepID=A0AAN6KX87_9PEZI|nr:Respiratory supercomplex factor 1, mitochondrial [Friedmanniomyces endolithicus]KAK0297340.1 Respiratory supercomplex factor 1, mitochondrial [Friedmanniomyces endolithicus]KAK0322987.1 Respiratory supercomplex factor 1, mitochondrial [Friedmanniomyces endolithicus]KAK0927299.1 Respiratory supercomplex factor 1, mitochondrial [Friedmanniomyces endolithicus]KAK0995855.1 Respiratory supercomplex factor 1, mitochondrial [Friedmanniomyces endolithicus]
MSVPGNINPAPPPSSFDDNTEFYEEARWQKLQRRLKEEPLIPLGCLLTCWALFEATRSMRAGDRYRTNRMFRRRIYAQGFTIVAMLAGSAFWQGDRKKRNQFNELVSDQQKKEKHEAWLRELEARQEEEDELQWVREKMISRRVAEKTSEQSVKKEAEARFKEDVGQDGGGVGSIRSVLEASERRREGSVLAAMRELWHGRR